MSKRLKTEQVKLQLEMQSKGLNIVSCGNCGTILIHRMGAEHIVCHDCGEHMELSSCPDLYYEGIPDSLPLEEPKDEKSIQIDAIKNWQSSNANDDFIFFQ